MSILINKKTKIIVQGITGAQASFHVKRAMNYGTNVVAGVAPNKKETTYLGLPLFSTVKEAKQKTKANTSIIFVPAKFAKSAILEAIEAEISLVVVVTSGIPVSDMMEIKNALQTSKTCLIGPNTPGVITPEEAYMGVFPDNIYQKGNIGIISRSSTLTYEVVLSVTDAGLGASTVVALGDDFIIGTGFTDIIKKMNEDKDTKAIVLVGGVGGNYEIEAAKFYRKLATKKPLIALVIDDTVPLRVDEGLATEIICQGITSIDEKKEMLEKAGIIVVDSTSALKEELLKL